MINRGLPSLRVAMSVAAVAAALAGPARAQNSVPADRIWTGGTILTMNDKAMRVEAVAAHQGRIVALGGSDEIMALQGANTEVIDLGGRALLPGFVDPHGHVFNSGFQALVANVQAPPDGPVTSIETLQEVLRQWADENADLVGTIGFIAGFGYDASQLAEGRAPTKEELDAVSQDLPVYIIHQSGHLGVGNSRMLKAYDIGADSEDPEGGVIKRQEGSREPLGELEENAHLALFFEALTSIEDPEFPKTMARAGVELFASYGYTTAQEGGGTVATARALRAVANEGGLPVDVGLYAFLPGPEEFVADNVSDEYVDHFRVAGAKLVSDGSPQGFTAWRDRPYYDPPEGYLEDYVGYPSATQEQVFYAADWAFENDIQLLVHANGEAAIDRMIGAIEAAGSRHGRGDRRPVLIHGQFMREDQVSRIKDLGIVPALFPMHTFYWGDWHRERTVGPERAENISPTGWMRERDMIFTTHHDAPVAFPNSMRVLDATVTRRTRSGDILGPAQRVDVVTALKAMTIWPAYQYFEENEKGSIELGKLADFVILSGDPTAVDPETLDTLEVVETIKEGETIYRREDAG